MRRHGRARISRSFPQALAICDRCGFLYNHADLHWSFDWQGPRLANQRILVCNTCDDVFFEHNRTILIPADPVPIANPRPEFYVQDDNPISPLGFDPLAQLLAAMGQPVRPPQPVPVPPVVLTPPITSSAGVYDADGNLVRTIWSAQVDDPRAVDLQASVWDGMLDDGTVAPSGSYAIQLLENNVTYAWEGVIGNSSPDHTNISIAATTTQYNLFSYYHSYGGTIWDMAITSAGEIYFTTGYDERLHTLHVTTESNPQYVNTVIGQNFREAFVAQHYCCTDDTNAYFAWQLGGLSFVWAIVCATKIPTVFSSIAPRTDIVSGYTIYPVNQVNDIVSGDGTNFITGIAVQKSGNFLFVSRGALNSIYTIDKTTGALLQTFTGVVAPRQMYANPLTGDLWVVNTVSASVAPSWDPDVSTPGITLSNSNLTATAATAINYAYSTASTLAKVYFEVVQNNTAGITFGMPIGVASTTTGRAATGFIGYDPHSFGIYGYGGYVINSVEINGVPYPPYGAGDNVSVAVDIASNLLWYRVNGGNWNGNAAANPATGTAGLATTTMGGPIYAALSTNAVGVQQTAHFSAASWTYAAPAGFGEIPGVLRTTSVTKMTVDVLGNLTSTVTAITGATHALDVAFSPDGTTVLVADGGTSQQVRAFNSSDGSVKTAWGVSGTLGTAGGYINSPPVTNTKFLFDSFLGAAGSGPASFLAYSSNGSFWVGDPGNCRYLHFSAGNSPTYIEQISYLPIFYSCWVCFNDPTRVFGSYLEFKVDYSKPLAVGNGSWTLVNNWFYGSGVFSSFGAMRYTITGTNGRTYVPIAGTIFEMTTTGYRNTGVSVSYDYIDRDFNLWGVAVTDPGAAAVFKKNRFAGFDGSNNPTWTTSPSSPPSTIVLTTPVFPSAFPSLGNPAGQNNASNYVEPLANGVIPVFDVHATHATQYHLGGIDSSTGALKFKTHPPLPANNGGENTFLFYPPNPYFGNQTPGVIDGGSGIGDFGGGFQAYVPGTTDVFTLYRGENWGSNQVSVWSHWHQSGLLINRTGTVAAYFGPFTSTLFPPILNTGNIDTVNASPFGMASLLPGGTYGFMGTLGLSGNSANGGIAFQNGSYYLYNNDEWYHGGVHRWRVSNPDKVRLSSVPVSWNSSSYVPPVPDPYNFLAGLPFNTVNLPNGAGGWSRNPTSNVGAHTGDVPHFVLYTNAINPDAHQAPDLAFSAGINNGTATASYSWTRVGSGNWTISGTISQPVVGTATETTSGSILYLDILDNAARILVRMYNTNSHSIPIPTGATFWVNDRPIHTPLARFDVWEEWIENPQPLAISADVGAGTMVVNYAGYTMTGVTPLNVAADITRPAQFKLTYLTAVGVQIRTALAITAMQFADVP